VTTEITDVRDECGGRVFYDAECSLCCRWAGRCRRILERNGFALVPLQSHEARRILNLTEPDLLAEMRVRTADGGVLGGADALLHLAKAVGWGWPLFVVASLPGMKPVLRRAYQFVARHRTCGVGNCRVTAPAQGSRIPMTAWLPLALSTAGTVTLCRGLPAWGYMWAITLALFAGCKWLSFWSARGKSAGVWRTLGFLFAWPGMDANTFLAEHASIQRPGAHEWALGASKVLFGITLIWGIAPWLFPANALAAGWAGITGLIFVLHFGSFDLLSSAWRTAGVNAAPIMRAPVLSRSLGEFWGGRWNTGFHYLSNQYLFRPLRRYIGSPAATMLVFLASGLVHDLVISVPARGGFGLPTAYFLVQGAGLLFEHTDFARRRGVGRGWRGWLFTLIVTAAPSFWLFHPPFILNVIIPFLKMLGAV
jgi:predicted DCC family thiol-disulfide oxidoreductase YuxK